MQILYIHCIYMYCAFLIFEKCLYIFHSFDTIFFNMVVTCNSIFIYFSYFQPNFVPKNMIGMKIIFSLPPVLHGDCLFYQARRSIFLNLMSFSVTFLPLLLHTVITENTITVYFLLKQQFVSHLSTMLLLLFSLSGMQPLLFKNTH